MQSINPKNGSILATHIPFAPEDVSNKIRRADLAFMQWRGKPVAQRAELMLSVANILRTDAKRYAELITDEMGKPIRESRAEIDKCAWCCEYFAEHAAAFLAPEPVQTDGHQSFVRF